MDKFRLNMFLSIKLVIIKGQLDNFWMIMENKEDLNQRKNFYSGASCYFKIENFFFVLQKVSCTTVGRLSWFTILTIKQKIK